MKTRTIIGIAVPVAVLGLALLFGSVLLLRLAFLSGLVVATGLAWTAVNLRNLSIRAESPPEHIQVGDIFHRGVTITNHSRLPRLWLKLRDETDLPGPQVTSMASIPGNGDHSWQTTFVCRRRGRYHLGPTTVATSDPFGLFRRDRTIGEKQDVLVHPATFDLPLFRFASYSDFGYGSGYQSISRISPNASSVREYASGDSLHHIHWRSTARTGTLMVKMFDADRSHNTSKTAWVLLDMNNESHYGRGDNSSDEMAVTIAASLVRKYLQGGMRVGMMASDEQQCFTETDRGEQHLWNMLETLALIKCDWKAQLADVATQRLDSFRDNPMVLIVATTKTPGLMEMVHRLRNRVDTVVVVVLDIDSFHGSQGALDMQRGLLLSGASVYTVRQGEDISRVLDTKMARIHPMLI